MSRYPQAEWVEWKYRSPDGVPTYYKGLNKPIAVVLHIAEGWQRTARQWALEGHNRASRHFSVGRDGSVMQHLELWDGGYHAGITVEQGRNTPPIWPLWKGATVNVNHYTIGIEHEGFHNEPWPLVQRESSRDLCTWLAGELGIPLPTADPMVAGALGPGDRYLLHYPPHAAIDRINRVNDFAPLAERRVFYEWLKAQGGDVDPRLEEMIWRMADILVGRPPGDSTNAHHDRQAALLQEWQRQAPVVDAIRNQQRELTAHLEDHPEGIDKVPEHKHMLSTINLTGGVQK